MELLKGKKKKAIFAVIALIALLGVGSTLAWVVWNLNVPNDLTSHTTGVEVVENFDQGTEPVGDVTKTVSFTNKGSSSVFLRIAYTEYWETVKDGEKILLSNLLDGSGAVATKNWTGGKLKPDPTWWYDAGDGWYYYKKILPSDKNTGNVLESVTFPASGSGRRYQDKKYKDYEDAVYSLYFRAEVVQASDGSGTLNSVEVNKKATSTVFGQEAAVGTNGAVTWTKSQS